MIKELHHHSAITLALKLAEKSHSYPFFVCLPTLDSILESALLSQYLINSLGIEQISK